MLVDVGIAIAFLEQRLAVLDDDDHRAGHFPALKRIGYETIEPGLRVFSRQLRRRFGQRSRSEKSRAQQSRRSRQKSPHHTLP